MGRLRQIHNATFVKVNKAIMNMLQRVQQYVTFGFPNRKTIESLVYKRGYGKVNGQRVRLSNNFIVNNLMTCGENFKEINNFMWPFKLSSPKLGYAKKSKSFLNGGDTGNRDHEINAFVR